MIFTRGWIGRMAALRGVIAGVALVPLGCAPELTVTATCGDGGGPSAACVAVCGDGVAAGAEACDGAELSGQTCGSLGFSLGSLTCGPDCTFDTTGCVPLEDCNSGEDEDQDGLFDCGDPECVGAGPCATANETTCDDVLDQDGDGLLDCEDPSDCQALAICASGSTPTGGPCDAPSDCQASDSDPFCIKQEKFEGWLEGYCSEFCVLGGAACAGDAGCFDTGLVSGNGLCLDGCQENTDCRPGYTCNAFGARSFCWPGVEVCDNTIDDENDGMLDCADPDCQEAAICAVCGDGILSQGEPCDDGNQDSGDGCSASCGLEGTPEAEPNDACAAPGGPFTPEIVVSGSVGSSDSADRYAINVQSTADLRIEVFTEQQACDVFVVFDGQGCGSGAVGDCFALDSTYVSQMRAVPVGVYYVGVFYNGGPDPVPYHLRITYNAVCGDGVVEGSEECDGGSGCTASCKLVTACGDGIVTPNEQCDDGNNTGGDGCTAACLFEVKPESEPNDVCVQSDGPFSPDFLAGGVITAGEVDYFAIVVPEAGDLKIETFGGGGPGTCSGDTVIQLLDTDCSTVLAYNDDYYNVCSVIDPANSQAVQNVAAGIYYVAVTGFGGSAVPDYTLQVTRNVCGDGKKGGVEECDGAPDCTSGCELITVCGDGVVSGDEQCDPPDVVSCNLSCRPVYPPESECNGLFDEDGDGLTNCEDATDCKLLPGCTPGNVPAGDPCTASNECQADDTDPVCIGPLNFGWPDGYCSQFCDIAANDCPGGAICIDAAGLPSGAGLCFKGCTADVDCRPGYYCLGDFCIY